MGRRVSGEREKIFYVYKYQLLEKSTIYRQLQYIYNIISKNIYLHYDG